MRLSPLFERENYQSPDKCNKLILIPHLFLHLLPFHALPINSSLNDRYQNKKEKSRLIDLFPMGVSYAPNCWQLDFAKSHKSRSEFSSFIAVQNPKDDLGLAKFEIEAIRFIFSDLQFETLSSDNPEEVTNELERCMSNADYCHFSCHGKFYPDKPLQSFLLVAKYINPRDAEQAIVRGLEEGLLTVDDIFELDLQKCYLITLSACETGKIDIGNWSDNYIGLPGSFMCAGSSSVVSTLWEVDEIATSLLMIKFNEYLKGILKRHQGLKSGDVAIALNKAQHWLRFMTPSTL